MNHLKSTILFAVALLLFVNANAASGVDKSVELKTFSIADGMPSNTVAMIDQAPDGLIWIATWNGLCNFDGYLFNTFTSTPGSVNRLHGNRLYQMATAANGDIWLTTFDRKLFRLDSATGLYVDCEDMLNSLGFTDFRVQDMFTAPDGNVVIQDAAGNNLVGADGAISKAKAPQHKKTYNTLRDKKNREWVFNPDGTVTNRLNGSSKTYTFPTPASWPVIQTEQPVAIEDLGGTIWLLANGHPVCYFDESADSLVPVNLRETYPTLPDRIEIRQPFVDSDRNLWFRNRYSLCEMSFDDKKFSYYPVAGGAETRSMRLDSKHRLWIGTKQGHLAVVDIDSKESKFMSPAGSFASDKSVFSDKGVYAIYEDSRNNVWIGTNGDGIFRLTPKGDGFEVQNLTKGTPYDNEGYSSIYDILEDSNGRIWFANYGGGPMYFDYAINGIVSDKNNARLKLPEGNIRKIRRIEAAPDGTLIFSTTEGIVSINPKFKRPADIKVVISPYSPNDANSLLAPDVLQTLVCRKSPKMLVATMGGGIQQTHTDNIGKENPQFSVVEHNFANIGNIRGIIEDKNGNIWVTGEDMLYRISADGTAQLTYTSNDWGRYSELSEARPITDPVSGKIIIGTSDGVMSFDPALFVPSGHVPPIVFTGIQYQSDERMTPITGNREITLGTDSHNALVNFAALDYGDNLQIRYAYRIPELDKEWTYTGTVHSAPLSNLPPGHYTLEVRSTNNEGVWVDNTATLKIYVEPTFWQTPWAIILYILIAGFVIFLAVYLLWLRKAHRMQKAIKERQLDFFTDISHRLRTPLTLISGPVTEVLATEKMTKKGRTLLKSVEKNAAEMLSLVNRSLDLEKLQISDSGKAEDNADRKDKTADAPHSSDTATQASNETDDNRDLTILVVEDNDELRYFLSSSLATRYQILEAANGREGLEIAADKQPDFIITDIMMPEMDGIEMIRHIKAESAICHIPIIILSARTADNYRIEGLKEGADDYITKPFNMSYLLARVDSIVRQRRLLQHEWQKSLGVTKSLHTESKNSTDNKFADSLTTYINENLHNPDLKIDDIASAMCMSRSVLYSKIKSIYGMSPNDVLRKLRVARACFLLRNNTDMPVADVAQAVGYNDPKYFSRYFKQSVGVYPSEYRNGAEPG